MPVVVSFPIVQDNTGHYGIPKGSTGRDGEEVVGICLHVLEKTAETYTAYLHSNRELVDIRPDEHGSIHYMVNADGTIRQFVQTTNTAWALQDLNNPTWDLLPDYSGINLNYVFINIGVEQYISAEMPTLMFRALAELCAKLCEDFDFDVDADHIISHEQLDDTFPECEEALPANLIATIQSILAQVSGDVVQDIGVIAAQVSGIDTRLTALEASVESSLETITTYADHVATKAGSSTLGHIKSSSTLSVDSSSGVANPVQAAALYKIVSGTQTIVAAIQSIVQFPTVISDVLVWVTLGAFQKVTPSILGLYRIRARIQFSAATWTAGKYIELGVYKTVSGGSATLVETIAYKVIEANLTTKIVEIKGECELSHTTVSDYYDCRITTDDLNGLKTIASGSFSCERIGA